jgi:hypothetical protein
MPRPRKKSPKPITFTLTPAQLRDLKKRGLLKKKSGTLKVTYRAGKLHVIRHKKGGSFVSSNAAFA